MADQIRGARFVSFPGVDHFYWAGIQDELLVEIERFVAEVGDEETDLDRVLATVMFTDIVDSTAQGAALGDRAWAEVRTQHDQIVRSNLVRFRGAVRSRRWVTGSSRLSMARREVSDAQKRSPRRCSLWASRSGPACTPGR